MSNKKPRQKALVGKWISIEYENGSDKAKWYKGRVKKFDTSKEQYLVSTAMN